MPDSQPKALLIRGGTVLSMDPDVGDIDHGDVLVEGGLITDVGTQLEANGPVDEIDATNCIVIPGMIDTHRHTWEAVLRGSAPHHTLYDYFEHVLGGIGPSITPDDAYVGESLGALGALESGITTLQDISNIQDTPEHSDAVIQALWDSGIRAVFSYAKSLPALFAEGTALPDDVRRVRSDVLSDSEALVTMALDTEAGDDDAERHNARLATELDLPVTRHVSTEWPVMHLKELGVLRPGTTFIHGNGLSDEELKAIADSGGSLSIAPAIEMMMGFGLPWVGPATNAGLLITLSVDIEVTCPSDMFTQMRALYQAARHSELSESGTHISVRDVLSYVTRNAAQSLGLDERTGSLTPGKEADLVVLRADQPGVAPVYDPYSTVVLQMDRSHVDTVLVGGRPMKRGGRLIKDSSELLNRARDIGKRLTSAGVFKDIP